MNTAFASALLMICIFVKNSYCFNFTLAAQCGCPFTIQPVCASAKQEMTFMNDCSLKCSQRLDGNLVKLYDGTCCHNRRCESTDNPVCDSRGELYPNYCAFEKRQCQVQRLERFHLEIDMSASNCSCVQQCTPTLDPVCDTFGRTHANICAFSNAKCMAKAMNEDVPELNNLGKCCEDLCTPGRKRFPVCDSLGNTYDDFCLFLVARCKATQSEHSVSVPQFRSFGYCT
ncbi:hypothetical protein QR680_001769 [Steinernema hermaphroditum]|uniref:Kazal-like domain-containing protein n=1 Tax=Steinernema hermaphroditum TaxID=289476 RepID=A0AA39H0N8_9BILA|nr:hypothetical protein QR680_001769 [Steinernema hermaphroditum]